MRRRGLTMVEILVALGLLSALMLTVTSWIQTTARASALAEPMRWRIAAQAVLQLIHDDLMTGDFEAGQQRRRSRQPRVMVESDSLRIDTRTGQAGEETGPTTHHYELDTFSDELAMTSEPKRARHTTRLLLDDVDRFTYHIDEERTMLTVSITSSSDQSIRRSYLLP